MNDLVEQVARNIRRDFNIREFDRSEDTGWEADIDEAERAIKAVDVARATLKLTPPSTTLSGR
ncbi:hypothetical protein [Rhizobium tumorigenes]|uniref:hypothetical protein n=1 Tax=Rhizobium tumorigenes TaxID=2041385 RepID=UPI00241C9754|nr:hypothetical protein [Rhizobium tumorigenes]WFS01568.1 hypothetical protein PR016_02740 [Rhizobium tumorigenes]